MIHDEHAFGIVTSEPPVRLLVVEHDVAVAEKYCLELELDGYTVTVASDGWSALQTALTEPPDLMFLDVRLPGMDGLAVLEALRRDDRTRLLAVVMLTDYSDPQRVRRAQELGALVCQVRSETPPAVRSPRVSWRSR
jgi:CheY-like chemotaxis protein